MVDFEHFVWVEYDDGTKATQPYDSCYEAGMEYMRVFKDPGNVREIWVVDVEIEDNPITGLKCKLYSDIGHSKFKEGRLMR